jgi:hypothetical protein
MQQSTFPDVRRQSQRRPVKANAFVHCRGQFQAAKVVDYSAGGLQLNGTFGLINSDPIQIEFMSGIRVLGRVAWSLGAQTGIDFFEPLTPEHPALIELFRQAGAYLSRNVIVTPATNEQKWLEG